MHTEVMSVFSNLSSATMVEETGPNIESSMQICGTKIKPKSSAIAKTKFKAAIGIY